MSEGSERVALIACAASKLDRAAPARALYRSLLFRLSLDYAERVIEARPLILSAEHGVVDPDRVLDPYDLSLTNLPANDVRAWAERVVCQLRAAVDVKRDSFVVLAGERYRRHLLPHLRHTTVPMEGLGIGRQLQWLRRQIDAHDAQSQSEEGSYRAR